jgi:hypothetical protein
MGENPSSMDAKLRTPSRHRRLRRAVFVVAALGAAILLSSCAADANPVVGTGEDSPGFLMGLWHGIIIFFTFVISLFNDNVTVYEVANDGNWYDFGFFLGLMISLGGMGAGTRRRKKRR